MKAVFYQHPKTYNNYDYSTNTNILIGRRKIGCIGLNQFYYTYQISKYKNRFHSEILSPTRYLFWKVIKESEFLTEDDPIVKNDVIDFYIIRQEFERYLSRIK